MKRLAIVIVVLLVSVTVLVARAQPDVDSAACSSEETAVVAAALKHALVDARDLPDLLIVERNDSVYVSDYLWGTECILKDTILPTSGGRTYVLLSRDEARDLANERDGITFARAGDVKIAEGEASVWVGASLRPADGDERGLTCCCGGQMFLRRDAGEWVFLRWGMRLCA
jgi:hypothetical protein